MRVPSRRWPRSVPTPSSSCRIRFSIVTGSASSPWRLDTGCQLSTSGGNPLRRGAPSLRGQDPRPQPACRRVRRQNPQGRQARRSPGRAADEVRAGHQPQDRQGPRPHDPAVAAGAGGSGDRVMDRRRFLLTSLAGALAWGNGRPRKERICPPMSDAKTCSGW